MRCQAMWAGVLCVVLLMVCSSAAAESDSPGPELDIPVLQVIEALNDLRLAGGLEAVHADSLRCDLLSKGIQRSINELGDSFFDESVWPGELDRRVEDLEKQGFLATAGSTGELFEELEAMPGFADAALSPVASHVLVAIGDRPGGGAWCAVWIIHRLVHLDPLRMVRLPSPLGPSALTLSGVSEYKHLLVESYRREGESTGTDGEVHSIPLETDESGAFRVTLSFVRPGPATYDIIIYVKAQPGDAYKAAARTHFSVPAWRPDDSGPPIIKQAPAPADSPGAR